MNRVVHFEIHAKDLDNMQKFYQSVFGWDIKDMGEKMGNYRIVVTGQPTSGEAWPGINGGMTPRKGEVPVEGQPVNAFVCTITVEDVDASVKKVLASGGVVALDAMNVPGVGTLAYCKDPEGNIFGVLQPAPAA